MIKGSKHTKVSLENLRTSHLGQVAWNKDLKGIGLGEENGMWKGEEVSYAGLHIWITRVLGRPYCCAYCGNEKLNHRQYHWANISHAYKRDLSDWIRLCTFCHHAYDRGKITLNG